MAVLFLDPVTGEELPPCPECGSIPVRDGERLRCSSCGVVMAVLALPPLDPRCGVCGRPPGLECRAHFVARIAELEHERDQAREEATAWRNATYSATPADLSASVAQSAIDYAEMQSAWRQATGCDTPDDFIAGLAKECP